MSEWISIKDRLPKEGTEVLAIGHEYNDPEKPFFFLVSMYQDGFKNYDFQAEQWSKDGSEYITHWMPLPAPPEK